MAEIRDPYITPVLAAALELNGYRCWAHSGDNGDVLWQKSLITGGCVDLRHYRVEPLGAAPLGQWEAGGCGVRRDDNIVCHLHLHSFRDEELLERLPLIENLIVNVYGILALHQSMVPPFTFNTPDAPDAKEETSERTV